MATQNVNPEPIAPTSIRTEYVENIGGVMSENLYGRGEQLGLLQPKGHGKVSGEPATANAPAGVLHDQRESEGARWAIAAHLQSSSPPTRGDLDVNTRTMGPAGSVHKDFFKGPQIGY